jgi:hypothetical protein
MAAGVNNNSRCPSGPLLEIITATTRPTTTGGRLIKVYKNLVTTFLNLNFFNAKNSPIGVPIKEEIIVEVKDTNMDRRMIEYISLSKDRRRINASFIPSKI